ncbi:MAG: hypothetical protein PHT78_11895, partial [Desulfitobacteriaceae bacterium]|nr:hypothetical protein [Desulfitobacteriaceae bacterium]
ELLAKNVIDRLHTDNPAWGSRQLSKQLKKQGYPIGRLKTRRYGNANPFYCRHHDRSFICCVSIAFSGFLTEPVFCKLVKGI